MSKLDEIMPNCDTNDPAALEAWYGNWGYAEHWRKCVLADCRELIRASSSLAGPKLSEARIDDLARIHPNYLDFLTTHLQGRRLREKNFTEKMGIG